MMGKKKKKRSYERRAQVDETPTECPKCEGIDREILSTTPFPGRTALINGRTHMGIKISRRRCLSCRQVYMVRSPMVQTAEIGAKKH